MVTGFEPAVLNHWHQQGYDAYNNVPMSRALLTTSMGGSANRREMMHLPDEFIKAKWGNNDTFFNKSRYHHTNLEIPVDLMEFGFDEAKFVSYSECYSIVWEYMDTPKGHGSNKSKPNRYNMRSNGLIPRE